MFKFFTCGNINFDRAACLYEQKSSDVTVASDMNDNKRGFSAAMMLPLNQGLLCVTADQQLLFYTPVELPEKKVDLILSKRLVGYNEEIVDMKFLDDKEQYLAVATNLEQVTNVLMICYSDLIVMTINR